MAYTAITVIETAKGGVRFDNIGDNGVAGGAGTGYKFSNDGNVLIYIDNTAGNTPSMVVLASGLFQGVALTTDNQTITPEANADYIAGPFPRDIFNDADGNARLYFSGGNETELTITPFKRAG